MEQEGGKLERFKSVATRASHVVPQIDVTSTFGTKLRIEKVGGSKKGANLSCLRHSCFIEEKIRFSRGKLVFYRLKVSFKTDSIAEVNEDKVVGGMRCRYRKSNSI